MQCYSERQHSLRARFTKVDTSVKCQKYAIIHSISNCGFFVTPIVNRVRHLSTRSTTVNPLNNAAANKNR